jgi:hypothetical protein
MLGMLTYILSVHANNRALPGHHAASGVGAITSQYELTMQVRRVSAQRSS